MWQMIDSMPEAERNATLDYGRDFHGKEAHWPRDKNLRDILIHLYEWHQLLLHWVNANQNGEAAPFLPPPYNWKTYAGMNVAFWEKHQSTSYNKAVALLKESHKAVMALIESFSDEALFTKKHFLWTGASTLGSYCVSVTSSHYDWAMKKIKQHLKARRKAAS
ncbi:MAG: ClbS/DfsB family four-helix bundle protein [Ruminococcaceae bacterium]|nr:ClbS/DfsB family four-helix bundle protein [Oscillospiraceae bacterium]